MTWQAILSMARSMSIEQQKVNKYEILKAVNQLFESGMPDSVIRNYLNDIVIFPEILDIVMEYCDRNGFASKMNSYTPTSTGR